MSAEKLAGLLQAEGVAPVAEYATLDEAYRAAHGAAPADARIVVFGSFSTVAEVMRQRQTAAAATPVPSQGG
jgi:folylpolyglutamate synthase/dihydropteroate synthase